MFAVQESSSFKELAALINRDALPKEILVNLDKVSVAEGIEEVTGKDPEVKELFAYIEKYNPEALIAPTEEVVVVEEVGDDKAEIREAIEALTLSLEFEEDEVNVAELNAAIEALNLSLEF